MEKTRVARARQQRREMILDEAQRIAFERGFDSLTIGDLASAADYTKRAVYFYFKDKDEIFFALVARGQKLLKAALEDVQSRQLLGPAGAQAFGDCFFQFSIAHPEYFSLLMEYESKRHRYEMGRTEESRAWAKCQNLSLDCGDILERWMEQEISSGRLKTSLSARQLMLSFWAQTYGIMQIILMRQDGFEEVYDLSERAFFDAYMEGIVRAYWDS
ncbi:MAG: helix-turn-helix domain-containing protein [Leptospiraceae bacterium]